ncbi:unnamed protein product [Aureobasidium uvarum]|uniref:Uncharacterized protein n=1 Tax=Aureobasidium uvarum TaxID=2773716 RepID=A0A9N8KPP5_9PEZI|nr:unnamed protein product [Aureobasidium uvarum]
MEFARSQEEVSAVLINQGRSGDALTAINEGLLAIAKLTKPLVVIRDRLKNLSTKGRTVITDGLQQAGLDREIETWDTTVTEWTVRMAMPTWKV